MHVGMAEHCNSFDLDSIGSVNNSNSALVSRKIVRKVDLHRGGENFSPKYRHGGEGIRSYDFGSCVALTNQGARKNS